MARYWSENDDVHIVLYVLNYIIGVIADDDKRLRYYIVDLYTQTVDKVKRL